jgi:acyl carrier protein
MSPKLGEVVAWLRRRHPEAGEIGPEDDLIDSRLIDSLGFLEFIVLIERLSGRPVDLGTLDVDDFRTLRRIDRMLVTRAEPVAPPG